MFLLAPCVCQLPPCGPENAVCRGWRKAGGWRAALGPSGGRAAQRGGLSGRPCLHVNDCFCLSFRVLSCSPQLLGLSPPPLEGQDSQMTPLKVNRTLPLCLRRNLLLRGLNRRAVSTLPSLEASCPPSLGGGGWRAPPLTSPEGPCSEPEGLPSARHVALRTPCAWKRLRSLLSSPRPVGPWALGSVWGYRVVFRGRGLRTLLAVGRAAAWPLAQRAVVAPPTSPPLLSSFPGWLRGGPGLGAAEAVAEATSSLLCLHIGSGLGEGWGSSLVMFNVRGATWLGAPLPSAPAPASRQIALNRGLPAALPSPGYGMLQASRSIEPSEGAKDG